MSSILQKTKVVFQRAATAQAIQHNPFGFALDTIIRLFVRFIIPVPFASELVIYFKGPILAFLAGGAILLISLLFMIIAALFTPASAINSVVSSFTGAVPIGQNLQVIIQALDGYIEEGFTDTNIPTKNPFGGKGERYSIRTAGFHSQGYFQNFGLMHEGQDIVPSQAYYAENKAYQLTGQSVIFATLSGNATTYIDSEGALTVAITNNKGTIQAVYKHFKQILTCNCAVQSGKPIGIMGSTGFSTGDHLHYEVRLNQGGTWIAVNPLDYIK